MTQNRKKFPENYKQPLDNAILFLMLLGCIFLYFMLSSILVGITYHYVGSKTLRYFTSHYSSQSGCFFQYWITSRQLCLMLLSAPVIMIFNRIKKGEATSFHLDIEDIVGYKYKKYIRKQISLLILLIIIATAWTIISHRLDIFVTLASLPKKSSMFCIYHLTGIYRSLMGFLAPFTEEYIIHGFLFSVIITFLNYKYTITNKLNPFSNLSKKEKIHYFILFGVAAFEISFLFGTLHSYQHHKLAFIVPIGVIRTSIDFFIGFWLRLFSGSIVLPLFFHLIIDLNVV